MWCWCYLCIENSDLDVAASEIIKLKAENEELRKSNMEKAAKLEASDDSVDELTKLNDITMHMVCLDYNISVIDCVLFLRFLLAACADCLINGYM